MRLWIQAKIKSEKNIAALRDIGADIKAEHVFADHHKYREDEVWWLLEEAQKLDALAVTTAKDAVRLPPAARGMVTIVNVTLLIDNAMAFFEMLNRALTAGKLWDTQSVILLNMF